MQACYRKLKTYPLLLLVSATSMGAPPSPSQQLILEQKREARDQMREVRQDAIKPKSTIHVQEAKQTPEPKETGACFDLKSVVLKGITEDIPAPDFVRVFEGTCISAAKIQAMMSKVNRFYQQEGYITTRVYVPKQNLQSGTLTLVVQAGVVEGFRYADKNPADGKITNAFPLDEGDVVQGLRS